MNVVITEKGSTTVYSSEFDIYQLFESGKVYNVPDDFGAVLLQDGRFEKTDSPAEITILPGIDKKEKSTTGTEESGSSDPVKTLNPQELPKKVRKKKGE